MEAFAAPPKRSSYVAQWVPTDVTQLQDAERRLLQNIDGHYTQFAVATPLCEINTIACVSPHHTQSMLLLHGFGSGLGQWVPNWTTLARSVNVYAIDMPGFGRSGRPAFRGEADDAILFFIQTIEEWMKAVFHTAAPPPMILVGHSFGGYVAGKFAASYPHRVRSLILVDAFGVRESVDEQAIEAWKQRTSPLQKATAWAAEKVFYQINPLSLLRGLGPLGPYCMSRKKRLVAEWGKTNTVQDQRAICDYLYHVNVQTPSGETAAAKCLKGLGLGLGAGFASSVPMFKDLVQLPAHIPLHFICGATSWISAEPCQEVALARLCPQTVVAVVVPPTVAASSSSQPQQCSIQQEEENVTLEEAVAAPANTAQQQQQRVFTPPTVTVNILPNIGHHPYLSVDNFHSIMAKLLR